MAPQLWNEITQRDWWDIQQTPCLKTYLAKSIPANGCKNILEWHSARESGVCRFICFGVCYIFVCYSFSGMTEQHILHWVHHLCVWGHFLAEVIHIFGFVYTTSFQVKMHYFCIISERFCLYTTMFSKQYLFSQKQLRCWKRCSLPLGPLVGAVLM